MVTKEFLAGLKTEGLVTMIRQHIISEWGAEGAEEKVLICNPCNLNYNILDRLEKHERRQRLLA